MKQKPSKKAVAGKPSASAKPATKPACLTFAVHHVNDYDLAIRHGGLRVD
jgi:hypothetical protein